MRTILLENEKIIFKFDYNKKIIISLKDLDAIYNPSNKTWTLPNDSFYYVDVENIINQHNFTLNQSMLKIKRFKELLYPSDVNTQVEAFLSKYTALNSEKEELNKLYKFTPRDYQWTAALMMLQEMKVLNGDDMGVGKSIEALMAIEIGELYPCLIVCPNSVKYNWAKYISKWMNRTYSVIEGKKSDNFNTDFVIVNYEKLGKKAGKQVKANVELKKDWGCVVVDESHLVKNAKSQRSKALSQILKPVDFRFFLTGTAATVRPIDIYNQFTLLGREDVIGSWKSFVFKYCGAHETMFGVDTSGATNLGQLNLLLRTSCYIRREKRDVLMDLPDIQTTILDVDINNRKEYKQAEENFIEFLQENYTTKSLVKKLKAETIVQLGILKRTAAIGKMKNTLDWIDDFLSTDNKLVVFTCTNEVIDIICTKYKCNKINGSVNIKKRQEYLEDFISNPESRILPLNIIAGGTGIDGLQEACSNILMVEWPDVPGIVDQAISRIDRSGQLHGMNVYKTLARDTIEEKLYDSLMNKQMVTDAINRGQSVVVENNLLDNILTHYM